MELTLYRIETNSECTHGRLYDGDTHICDTLEDRDRGLKTEWELATIAALKVKGKTAIPTGRYEIEITFSNRFQKPLPILKDVKGFLGIRIHAGNRAEDSEGCILVGERLHPQENTIANSRKAFAKVYKLIGEALLNEEVYITITK